MKFTIYKQITLTLVCACYMESALCLRVEGTYSNPPQAYVTVSVENIPWHMGAYPGAAGGQCTITVQLGGGDWSKPVHRYYLNGYVGDPHGPTSSSTCFGVSYRLGAEGMLPELISRVQRVQVPYYDSRGMINICTGAFYLNYVSGAQISGYLQQNVGPGQCTESKPPVTCSIGLPGLIEHKPTTAGGVISHAGGAATVRCSGRASVSLTTPLGIALHNGKDKLDSRLYVQREGTTNVTVTVDTSAVIDLLSTIDSIQPSAGSYSGSGVIVATWE